MDLFSDLKQFGISNIGGIFEEEAKEQKKAEAKKERTPEEIEAEILFDKSHVCPVCDKHFTVKAIRAGKARLIATDTDLRAVYEHIDVNKYDAVVCPVCGYSALVRYFDTNTAAQRKLIREQISANFRGLPPMSGAILSYDEALLNLKMVLANAIVKKARSSEKAYICLKTAWVLRGKREHLEKHEELTPELSKALETEELNYIKQAYHGFSDAVSHESFPICGMDDMTLDYLMADMARKLGDRSQALKFLGEVIVSKTAKKGLRDKAIDLKELIMAESKK